MKNRYLFLIAGLALTVSVASFVRDKCESLDVVVIDDGYVSNRSDLSMIPFSVASDYIALETGEVIPDFIPGVIGEEDNGYATVAFKPPVGLS